MEKKDKIPVYDKNGLRFACLAYTQYTNGLPTPQDAIAHVIYTSDTETIERQIKEARALADVVLVSVHWGNEDSHTTTDEQRALAQQDGRLGCRLNYWYPPSMYCKGQNGCSEKTAPLP